MGEQRGETTCVDTLLASSLDSVDGAEDIVLKIAEEVGFEQEDLHKIGMAVRETVVNAVVHGNRYNKHKKVHLSLRNDADRIIITVVYQGEGFDLATRILPGISIFDAVHGDTRDEHGGR